MNKRSLRHFLSWLKHIKTWQLVIMLMIGVVLSASFLRLNNLEMDRLRSEVVEADKQGDTALIQQRMIRLQNFVSGHMNTSLGKGFYLEHKYNRDREAALKAAENTTNPNASVYQQASVECRARWQGGVSSFRNDYVTCVQERVKALGVAEDPASTLKLPKAESYHYNFISPAWSPDPAGFSVLVCVVITSVIILRLLSIVLLRLLLKHRFTSI